MPVPPPITVDPGETTDLPPTDGQASPDVQDVLTARGLATLRPSTTTDSTVIGLFKADNPSEPHTSDVFDAGPAKDGPAILTVDAAPGDPSALEHGDPWLAAFDEAFESLD